MKNSHTVTHQWHLMLAWSMISFGVGCSTGPNTNAPAGAGSGSMTSEDRTVVGYYDLADFTTTAGQDFQIAPIVAGGGTPSLIDVPSKEALADLDVLWVDREFFRPITVHTEWVEHQADLDAAVQSGMVLVVHDSGAGHFEADGNENYGPHVGVPVPGGSGIEIHTDDPTDDTTDINLGDTSTPVTAGLTDTSLDFGGDDDGDSVWATIYAVGTTLPPNSKTFLTRTAANESVTFCYPYGRGAVIYSSIPLAEFTADEEGPGYFPPELQHAMTQLYAPNIVRYALAGACKL